MYLYMCVRFNYSLPGVLCVFFGKVVLSLSTCRGNINIQSHMMDIASLLVGRYHKDMTDSL